MTCSNWATQRWIWVSEQHLQVLLCFLFSFQQVQCSCWDIPQMHFKRIETYVQLIISNEESPWSLKKKKKNLVTFSNRNTPTKCFLLKYWWRRTSGLIRSIQGTQSSATTTRKHWIPFCKARKTRHVTLIKHGVSNSSTDFPYNSTFLPSYE